MNQMQPRDLWQKNGAQCEMGTSTTFNAETLCLS